MSEKWKDSSLSPGIKICNNCKMFVGKQFLDLHECELTLQYKLYNLLKDREWNVECYFLAGNPAIYDVSCKSCGAQKHIPCYYHMSDKEFKESIDKQLQHSEDCELFIALKEFENYGCE